MKLARDKEFKAPTSELKTLDTPVLLIADDIDRLETSSSRAAEGDNGAWYFTGGHGTPGMGVANVRL